MRVAKRQLKRFHADGVLHGENKIEFDDEGNIIEKKEKVRELVKSMNKEENSEDQSQDYIGRVKTKINMANIEDKEKWNSLIKERKVKRQIKKKKIQHTEDE